MAKLMLSVVIPVKNNAKTLPLVLVRASRHLMRDAIAHEIIIIDNNSSDASLEIAERLITIIPNLQIIIYKTNTELGLVIKEGASKAKGEYIIVLPADGSVSVEEFHKMKRYLENGEDIIWGLRNYEDSFKIIYNLFARIPYFRTILDSTSKIFCFKNSFFKKILLQTNINNIKSIRDFLQLLKNYQCKIKYLALNI